LTPHVIIAPSPGYNRRTGSLQTTMTPYNKELASANNGFSLISNQKLFALYATMLECRRIAERSHLGLKTNKLMGSLKSILGQEAAAVGTAIDLLPGDTVVPTLWPIEVLKAINPSVSIASKISIAAPLALPNEDCLNVSVLFSSSERTSQASWQRALNFAAIQKLPTIFVSFNRRLGTRTPIDAPHTPQKKRGYTVPSISVDGNDVVAVYRVASEAIAHARKKHGPTLIECLLVDTGDPIQNMKNYLVHKGLLDEQIDGLANDKVGEWALGDVRQLPL
jgi:TPP-dependent pyruvate/acetoin dehydrogenase alpha subunit